MLRFSVSNKRERQQFEHHAGPIEFGRGPKRDGTARCVIQDLSVSRDHVRIDELNPGQVRVENLSTKNPIRLTDGSVISPGNARDLGLPLRLTVGETLIDVELAYVDPVQRESLQTIAHQPVRARRGSEVPSQSLLTLGGSPTPETLAHWFETVISVQRAAAGSQEFYYQSARALVELIGLDRGLVLMRKGDGWEVVARAVEEMAAGREYSHSVLKSVVEERRTLYQPTAAASSTESLQGVEAVVASPIFDNHDNVVGVLYGSRTRYAKARGIGIGPLEAQVVQVLASAIGAGLARQEQEAEAARIKGQFDMFFSDRLAQELRRNPQLLEGQQRVVTVMFCDIRGFSRIANQLKDQPHECVRLVSEVMDLLTARVRDFDGVVVDYMGDGLLAMWNAPADQPDHAVLACRAAQAILGDVPAISRQWEQHIGGRIGIGIGINTGQAMVGNTGSKYKFKYGPIGDTINIGSRVEGATKRFGIPLLITGETKKELGDAFQTRKIFVVRLLGIEKDPKELYQVYPENPPPDLLERRDIYEQALGHWMNATPQAVAEWGEVCRIITPLITVRQQHDNELPLIDTAPVIDIPGHGSQAGQSVYDIPSLELMMRSIECLRNPPDKFDPVIDITSK